MTILVGADPELFVQRLGEFVSGFGLIPGTKKAPHKVKGGAVQVDGMALEFNIDPASDADTFTSNIESVLSQMVDMLPEGVEPLHQQSVELSEEFLQSQPKEAVEIGCDPDFSAWDIGAPNERMDENIPIRCVGGHVHIGWGEDLDIHSSEHMELCCLIATELDYRLAFPSLLFDKDTNRRGLYGKLGSFRPKPYGMEYRTLSNFWITNPVLCRWVFSVATKAAEDTLSGKRLLVDAYRDFVRSEMIHEESEWRIRNYCESLLIEVPDV